MFQRHRKARKAGFIRRLDGSRMKQAQIYKQSRDQNLPIGSQFSPFKDVSPQPIDKILEAHGHKNTSRFQQLVKQFHAQHRQPFVYKQNVLVVANSKKQKRRKNHTHKCHKNQSSNQIDIQIADEHSRNKQNWYLENQIQQKIYKDEKQNYSRQQKNDQHIKYQKVQRLLQTQAVIITQSNEQIHQISVKPETFNLSLAESFNIHCRRMKQKLENERIKFSKSRNKINRQFSKSMQLPKSLKNKPSFDSTTNTSRNNQNMGNEGKVKNYFESVKTNIKNRHQGQQRIRRRSASFNQNKQNSQQMSNYQCFEQKTARASPNNKQCKFFVPLSSHRSKPITPRQAYEHSLKKWKQLPEVLARQKQREKQQHMRQRLSKMKAHSIEVRQKLKKN